MSSRLHVIESGSGPTVVLVHGAMERAGGLARVARHLRHLHVVRYDRRGYAGSAALGPGALDAHVSDLVDLLGEIGPDPSGRRPVVVGHSMGGLVALGAAHADPALVGAVGAYEPPTPWQPDWPVGIEGWRGTDADAVDLVVERAIGTERWARAPAALRAVRRAEGGAMMAEMRSLLAGGPGSPPAALGPVPVPASLAVGSSSGPHAGTGAAHLVGVARLPADAVQVLDGPAHRAPTTHASLYAAWCETVLARAGHPAAAVVEPSPAGTAGVARST